MRCVHGWREPAFCLITALERAFTPARADYLERNTNSNVWSPSSLIETKGCCSLFIRDKRASSAVLMKQLARREFESLASCLPMDAMSSVFFPRMWPSG